MDLGPYIAAVLFGLRHGLDWDHIAAITDMAGSQETPRRSIVLSSLYALGHGVVVVVLGVLAIAFAASLPDAVDGALRRVAGVALIVLGIYILWSLVRRGPELPTRSRWMLVIAAGRRVGARLRRRDPDSRLVVIEHSHPHDHAAAGHEHEHDELEVNAAGELGDRADRHVAVAHGHLHDHVLPVPRDPFADYTAPTAFGIGMLHGVGAETPTQVLLFVAAEEVGGTPASLGMLLCFVVGVLVTNTAIAVAATSGFAWANRHRGLVAAVSIATAAFSLGIGAMLLAGRADSLPTLLS